ncbi:hypothetical protein M422DRAFT_54482 [Sphaerobolus stellatus SS14]|uniref:Uncharacterized protein n=1 Tax=Sphaerobolus stellatus (strain SS14) TaxID=990650 RepID=A0A0C9TH38_SPHS4|nr:hypothetical protein M422DRAFT_54482 [Sphaerobolus stellatus SS14]
MTLWGLLQPKTGKLFKGHSFNLYQKILVCTETATLPPNELVQLETWQRPSEFVPKVVQHLCDILEWDEAGEILTSVDGARKLTEKYLDSLWGLVPDKNGTPTKTPIPWTEIRRQRDDLGQFIEARRLPTDNVIFERPKDMPKNDLWEFIDHIIKGEKGGRGGVVAKTPSEENAPIVQFPPPPDFHVFAVISVLAADSSNRHCRAPE